MASPDVALLGTRPRRQLPDAAGIPARAAVRGNAQVSMPNVNAADSLDLIDVINCLKDENDTQGLEFDLLAEYIATTDVAAKASAKTI